MATQNLERLKAAYTLWHESKGSRSDAWLDLLSDKVRFRSMGGASPSLAFADERRSKLEVVAYFTGFNKDWSMLHWTPETFVSEDDRIAVFGSCAWRHRATGKVAEVATSHLWTFEDGKVVEVIEVFDSARAVSAATL